MGKELGSFIKIYRSIFEHWIFQDAEKFKAFVDLIQLARWKEEKLLIGNELVTIPRGSYYTSELKLSERWGWSRKKTRDYLNLLENEQMITKKSTTRGTMLTIVNYSFYQDIGTTKDTTKGTAKEQPKDNEGTTEDTTNFEKNNFENLSNENVINDDFIEGEVGKEKDTSEMVDISSFEGVEGTTKDTTEEQQKNNIGYNAETSKEHQRDNEGYTKEEYKEINKKLQEGEERKEEYKASPLPFPTSIHKAIFNQFGEVSYNTWFKESEIEVKGELIIITVPLEFAKQAIESHYLQTIKTLTGKGVSVRVKTEGDI